jgi:pimeloyl-ACP methyl ester carboxylesterase
MRRGYEDAVMNMHKPVVYGAAEELARAYAELRDRLGLKGRVGVMGGSIGAAVAQLVTAEGELEVSAAVLVSPVVQLRGAVEAMGRRFGVSYPWAEDSNAVADRLDFLARADELADAAVMLVVGEDDDPEFRAPAAELTTKLRRRGATAQLVTIPGMAHALAEEPGTGPAPQTDQAAAVDRVAAEWFQRHLAASD